MGNKNVGICGNKNVGLCRYKTSIQTAQGSCLVRATQAHGCFKTSAFTVRPSGLFMDNVLAPFWGRSPITYTHCLMKDSTFISICFVNNLNTILCLTFVLHCVSTRSYRRLDFKHSNEPDLVETIHGCRIIVTVNDCVIVITLFSIFLRYDYFKLLFIYSHVPLFDLCKKFSMKKALRDNLQLNFILNVLKFIKHMEKYKFCLGWT